jgi:hypothetical protein
MQSERQKSLTTSVEVELPASIELHGVALVIEATEAAQVPLQE